jgi:predicted outer membrane repeat protein
VGVEAPDNGASGFIYYSNLLTAQAPTGGDNLSTSDPTAVHSVYADQNEDDAIMERFQVECDNIDSGTCVLSSVTVDDLGTATTGDWDNIDIFIDTDTSFAGATQIGQLSSFDGTSSTVSLNMGTQADRTVTNGTPKYVFVVYDLNSSIAVDTTLQSRVTAVGVASPDTGVTGITYDSVVVTAKNAISVGSGKDYSTIQAAINAASNGDIIIVSNGTYTENVNHSPPSVTTVLHIYSANGPENTTINGSASGRVVTLGYRSSTSTLSGFTITNGSVASIGGAGIYINMAQPTIDNCIITGNDAGTYSGGGIHINHSSSDVTITNTTISSNNGGNGGGLYMPSGTNATITNVVFDQNTATDGGAIYFSGTDATTTISDSTFTDNSSTDQGGAFYITNSLGAKFYRCIITGNHADTEGGVMFLVNSSADPEFYNCIIADNYAPRGGVIRNSGGGSVILNSCTIADNTATGTGGTDGGGIMHACSGTINVDNSIAWGNTATSTKGHNVYRDCTGSPQNVGSVDYSDFDTKYTSAPYYMWNATVTGGNNIDPATDPQFVDSAGGDYHLCNGVDDPHDNCTAQSPAIDAGTSTGAPSDDIDGDSRPYNGLYDMGADEYTP